MGLAAPLFPPASSLRHDQIRKNSAPERDGCGLACMAGVRVLVAWLAVWLSAGTHPVDRSLSLGVLLSPLATLVWCSFTPGAWPHTTPQRDATATHGCVRTNGGGRAGRQTGRPLQHNARSSYATLYTLPAPWPASRLTMPCSAEANNERTVCVWLGAEKDGSTQCDKNPLFVRPERFSRRDTPHTIQ